MASKGYGNLWIMAIGLIAIFVVATVIAPQLMGSGKTSSGNGWNTDMPSGEAVFNAPSTSLPTSGVEGLKANDVVNFDVQARPVAETTGKGGVFAWIFQLEGANGKSTVADLKYNHGSDTVVWSQGSNGAIVGVGPRFIQGPGAASIEVSSSLSLAITDASNDYKLNIWIASSSSTSDINPNNYTSVSPMVRIAIGMEKTVSSSVSVNQAMSGPYTVTEGEGNDYTVTSTAAASGRWSQPITTYISIEKAGIKKSDVTVRINTGSGYSSPSVTDEGDSLVMALMSKTPLTGRSDPESASWAITFEMSFATAGNYTLTSWAESGSPAEEVTTQRTTGTINVQTAAVIPEPLPQPGPVDPNSTDNSTVNQSQTAVVPVVDNNGSSNNGVPASNGRNNND